MKTCIKCGIRKELTEFSKCSNLKKAPDGLQGYCKLCNKKYIKQFHLKNPKYNKSYQEQNKEYYQKYRLNNSEHIKKYHQKWAERIKGIYEWYEGDTSLYIGQSKQLNGRIANHQTLFANPEMTKNHRQAYLYEALRQHQNPQIRIIEECSPEALLKREQHYIDIKKPLYNKYSK
jgi:hypothetical protein